MEKKEYIELLKDNVLEWNSFRARHKKFLPDLENADLQDAYLEGVNFKNANLRGAKLQRSNLRQANMYDADLENALLWDADVSNADLTGANLKLAQLDGLKFNKKVKALGAKVEECTGNAVFKCLMKENDYIEAVQLRHAYFSKIWWLISDYGRSLLRLSILGLIIILLFACVYLLVPDLIIWPIKQSNWEELFGFKFMPIYYSTIVFSSFGDGTISPANSVGQIVVCMEVLLGYMWLGVFIAVVVRKFIPNR